MLAGRKIIELIRNKAILNRVNLPIRYILVRGKPTKCHFLRPENHKESYFRTINLQQLDNEREIKFIKTIMLTWYNIVPHKH